MNLANPRAVFSFLGSYLVFAKDEPVIVVMRPKTLLSCVAIVAILAAAFIVAGCTQTPAGPTIVNVTNTIGTSTAPGVTPSPIPAPGAVAFVRVGFFGGRCPDGSSIAAGQTTIRRGCTGFATATPLDANDEKLSVAIHGPRCDWTPPDTLTPGAGDVVQMLPQGNPFNRDVLAREAGQVVITATVQGVTGRFTLTVVE